MRIRELLDGTYNVCIHHPGDVDVDNVQVTPKFTLVEGLNKSDLETLSNQIDAILRGETVMPENNAARESRSKK